MFTCRQNSEHFKLECFCADVNGAFGKCQEGKKEKTKQCKLAATRLLTKEKRCKPCGSFEKRMFPRYKNKLKQISFPGATKTLSAWMKWKVKMLRGKSAPMSLLGTPGFVPFIYFFGGPPHYPSKAETRCLPARDSPEISAREELRRDERLDFKFYKQRWNADGEEERRERVAPSQIVFRVSPPRYLPATTGVGGIKTRENNGGDIMFVHHVLTLAAWRRVPRNVPAVTHVCRWFQGVKREGGGRDHFIK